MVSKLSVFLGKDMFKKGEFFRLSFLSGTMPNTLNLEAAHLGSDISAQGHLAYIPAVAGNQQSPFVPAGHHQSMIAYPFLILQLDQISWLRL